MLELQRLHAADEKAKSGSIHIYGAYFEAWHKHAGAIIAELVERRRREQPEGGAVNEPNQPPAWAAFDAAARTANKLEDLGQRLATLLQRARDQMRAAGLNTDEEDDVLDEARTLRLLK